MYTTSSQRDNTIWYIVAIIVLLFIVGFGYNSRSYATSGYTRTPSSTYQSTATLGASAYSATSTTRYGNAIRISNGQVCNYALYQSEGLCVALQ